MTFHDIWLSVTGRHRSVTERVRGGEPSAGAFRSVPESHEPLFYTLKTGGGNEVRVMRADVFERAVRAANEELRKR